MDHLPEVVGAITPNRVPCVCDPHFFDGGTFETFPERKGYRLIEHDSYTKFILNADGSRLTPEQLASIAQAWLFFGFLTETLKVGHVLIDPEDFVQRDGTAVYITTRRLPYYLDLLEQAGSLLPTKAYKPLFRRQSDMMTHALVFRFHQFSDHWIHDTDYWRAFTKLPAEAYKVTLPLAIELSICVLQETLDRSSRRAFGINHSSGGDYLCKGLVEGLPRGGWCPSEISLILHGFDDTSAFFASRLERRRTKADHSKCSANKCRAFNIVTEVYKTQHTEGCRGCADVSIDNDELAAVLRLNKTPRVRIKVKDTNTEAQIKVTITDSGPYVAISHVWSDGLGNATTNALPSCQLVRLHNLTAKLGGEFTDDLPAIWIDTLLVPVKKGVEKRMALGRLSQYYREATKVLVLDSDLLNASHFCSQEEQLARVFFSTWMRRLWTLEEGILSRDKLEFQFNDGVISMKQLSYTGQISSRPDTLGNTLCQMLEYFLPDIAYQYLQQPEPPQARLNTIPALLPILQYRLTTKAADEPLCVSHILGLDATTMLFTDEADLRMKELLKHLMEHGTLFPRRLLFTNEPKLKLNGTSWAPASFMAIDQEDVFYLNRDDSRKYGSYLPDKGLLVDGLNGFLLDFGDETFKSVTFVECDKRIYALTPTPMEERCQGGGTFWSRQEHEKALNPDTALHWSLECQKLIGKSPRTTAVVYETPYAALLVSFYHFERLPHEGNNNLVYAQPISRLYMRELKTQNQNYIARGADTDVIRMTNPDWDFEQTELQMHVELDKFHDPATSTFLRCKCIDPSQRWCIG